MRILNIAPIHFLLYALILLYSICDGNVAAEKFRKEVPHRFRLNENSQIQSAKQQQENALRLFLNTKGGALRKKKVNDNSKKITKNGRNTKNDKKSMKGDSGSNAVESSSVVFKSLSGVVALALVENTIKKILQSKGYNFPAMLGGCLLMFFFLLITDFVIPGLGESIFLSLSPAASLLAKWIGVFFVPGLVMLPLAPSIGSGIELLKVFAVILGGFTFSLSTVAFSVMGFRKLQGATVEERVQNFSSASTPTKSKATKPFNDRTMKTLAIGALISLPTTILVTRSGALPQYSNSIQMVAMLFTTICGYVWGARLPPAIIKIVHPILSSAIIALLASKLVSVSTGASFQDVLRTYRVGSLNPKKTGAGDILLYLLGPSTVSFSISMFGRRKLLKENLLIVLWSNMIVSSTGGLFATALFVRLIRLTSNVLRLSIIPRNVTTPLAIVISEILGGNMAIAASMAIATAIIGGTYGRTIMSFFGINDPVARGLAIGAAGQGLGVASLVGEPDAFPFAAMSLVLTAIFGTSFVCIPQVKAALIKVALGS